MSRSYNFQAGPSAPYASALFIDGSTSNTSVGIGTTAPAAKLHVVGTQGMLLESVGAGGSNDVVFRAAFPQSNMAAIGGVDGHLLALGSFGPDGKAASGFNPAVSVLTNATSNAVRLGIGTTSPVATLHAAGNARLEGVLGFQGAALQDAAPVAGGTGGAGDRVVLKPAATDIAMPHALGVGSGGMLWASVPTGCAHVWYQSGVEAMRIDAGTGNVGIGTSSPQHKLEVVGEIFATQDITLSSDARLKTDLQPIDGALERVGKLRGYTYQLLEEAKAAHAAAGAAHGSRRRRAGVLAQDVQRVLPEAISFQHGHMSVSYGSALTALLVQAINELQERVARLEQAHTE